MALINLFACAYLWWRAYRSRHDDPLVMHICLVFAIVLNAVAFLLGLPDLMDMPSGIR